MILGALVHWTQARTGTLPAFLGWSVLALGMAGVILIPLSGFWLFFPQAVLILAVARQGRSWNAIAEKVARLSSPGDHADKVRRTLGPPAS